MTPPAISVLLPVYNGERYLERALESVLAQDFGDFELLLLDDGSTDGTAAIGRAFARRDPRVLFVSRENRGLVTTLNELLESARAPLVARMDADDLCLPGRFEAQRRYLEQHPDIVCVGSNVELIDAEDRYLAVTDIALEDAAMQERALAGSPPIYHPSAMIRTSALLRIGGYDSDAYPCEDLALWLRLGELGRLANLPQPLLRYRLHAHSVTANNTLRQQQTSRRICEEAHRRRGIPPDRFAPAPAVHEAADSPLHRLVLRFGWLAFGSGERRTSIHYGMQAVRSFPTNPDCWRLLACALFKPIPARRQRSS